MKLFSKRLKVFPECKILPIYNTSQCNYIDTRGISYLCLDNYWKTKSLLLHLNTLQSPWSYASQKRPCLKVSYRWLVIFINFTSSFFVCFSVIEGCIITAVYMAWILSITQSKTWETVRDATFPIMYLHCWWALKREKDEHREICIYYIY